MLFDSHAHLNFKAYDEDRRAVLDCCRKANMFVMNVGAAFDTSQSAVELALNNDFCYAAIGLHPIHVFDEEFEAARYQELIDEGRGKVRAIGETGIDLWHIKKQDITLDEIKEKQKHVFRQQIELAQKNDLAVILHGRNGKNDPSAYEMIYAMVQEQKIKHGVIHCFGGDLEEALMFEELGMHVGFTGIATFDKTGMQDTIIMALKIESIVVETDAPYLAPAPYRGQRNEPLYVVEVARHIAKIRNMKLDEVVEITGNNAKKLFKIF